MNLERLFNMQKLLDDRIEENHPTGVWEDRAKKRHVALIVELGEMMNEHKGFKFWSTNQKPRVFQQVSCTDCNGTGNTYHEQAAEGHNTFESCLECDGTGIEKVINPLLFELVDGLHFILSLGIMNGFIYEIDNWDITPQYKVDDQGDIDIEQQFLELIKVNWKEDTSSGDDYLEGLQLFLGLIGMLGFTWEQVEQAYSEKNKVNHQRQQQGY